MSAKSNILKIRSIPTKTIKRKALAGAEVHRIWSKIRSMIVRTTLNRVTKATTFDAAEVVMRGPLGTGINHGGYCGG